MLKTAMTAVAIASAATGASAVTFGFDFSGSIEFNDGVPATVDILDVNQITPGSTLGFGDFLLEDSFDGLPLTLNIEVGGSNAGTSFEVDYSDDGDDVADGFLSFILGETTRASADPDFILLRSDVQITDSNGSVSFVDGVFLFTAQHGVSTVDSFSASVNATETSVVPLPATGLMLGGALAGLVLLRRRFG